MLQLTRVIIGDIIKIISKIGVIMIFRVKKALFREIDDYAISADGFFVKAAKLLKGYYLYGKDGGQVGQIIFEKAKATVVVAEGASLCVLRGAEGYTVCDCKPDEDTNLNAGLHKQSPEYMIYGQTTEYRYDIYEKTSSAKKPLLAASVINDLQSPGYYKVRIIGGSNILKLIMMALAIDKLNLDPESLL